MFLKSSVQIWKRDRNIPDFINTYFMRKALKMNSRYCTRGDFNPHQLEIIHSHDEEKAERILEQYREYEGKYDEKGEAKSAFWKCTESDVSAYYFLFPNVEEGKAPILMEFVNDNSTTANPDKVVVVNFEDYEEAHHTSLFQAIRDFFGVLIIGNVCYYTHKV
jgi:hypothetical protein